MEPVYKWKIKSVTGRPVFTDKFGNVRENVIKTVILEYIGELEDKTEKEELIVNFNLEDLSNFLDHTSLTSDDVIQMALNSRPALQIESIESFVKNKFGNNNNLHPVVNFEFE